MILAIDQGTSSTKACIFEPSGALLGSASIPVARSTQGHGAVTQDPLELVESCRSAASAALNDAGLEARRLTGAALANQGESFLLFSPAGEPLSPAISWQDTVCGEVIDGLVAAGARGRIEAATGLRLHAEFTAPKLAHHLAGADGTSGMRFGTLDTWLIHQLSPDRAFVTDRATASRTMLVALDDPDWTPDLLEMFSVPRDLLPDIRTCDAMDVTLVLDGIEVPLLASGYDMGLALLGHGCLAPGDTKATFGTCLGVMTATGEVSRADGLLTTIAYVRAGSTAFALDGEVASAGALVDWALRIGIGSSLRDLDELATSVPGSGGVVLVPAIQGLGAPHWREDVRAAFVGMSEATGRPHLARAVFDAIAWSFNDVLEALASAGRHPAEVSVDGGLTHSQVLLQRCADVAQVPLRLSRQQEATAFGAAALAMLGAGQIDLDAVRGAVRGSTVLEPRTAPAPAERDAWRDALSGALAST